MFTAFISFYNSSLLGECTNNKITLAPVLQAKSQTQQSHNLNKILTMTELQKHVMNGSQTDFLKQLLTFDTFAPK